MNTKIILYITNLKINNICGYGIHGYVYDPVNVKGKTKNKPNKWDITDNGYRISSSKVNGEHREVINKEVKALKEVSPIEYYDEFGYFLSNDDESDSLLPALTAINAGLNKHVLEIDLFITDKEILDTLKDIIVEKKIELKKGSASEELASQIVKTKVPIKVSVVKTKENIGVHHVIHSAMIGGYGKQNKNKTSLAKGYWKPTVTKHPFLDVKQTFFISNTKNNPNEYLIANYDDEVELGKPSIDASYGVVMLSTYDMRITDMISKFNSINSGLSRVSTVRLSDYYKSENNHWHNLFGNDAYIKGNDKFKDTLSLAGVADVVKEIRPQGLAFESINNFESLKYDLKDYLNYKETGKPHKKIEYIDITNMFFEYTNKFIFKKDIVVGQKDVKYKYKLNGVDVAIVLQFGKDVLGRNALKRCERLEPKVILVITKITTNKVNYKTIIELNKTKDIGIWSSYYSNDVYAFKKKQSK